MIFELVYDLKMYQWLLNPIKQELERRGHIAYKSQTISDGNVPKKCVGSLAIQDVAYKTKDLPTRPRFFMNHGSSASKYWDLNMPIDYFISPSEYWTKHAKKKRDENGYHYQIIGDLGYPRMDVIVDLMQRRDHFREKIRGLFGDKPIVVCFPTYKKPNKSEPWIRSFDYGELVTKLDKDYLVLVFPHQMDDTKEFENILTPEQIIKDYDLDRIAYFVAADVILSDTSGAAYEACGANLPIVLMDSVHKLESTGPNVDFAPVATLDTVVDIIESQLQNPNEYAEKRKWWAEYILGPCDGNASSRIVDVLETICRLVQ